MMKTTRSKSYVVSLSASAVILGFALDGASIAVANNLELDEIANNTTTSISRGCGIASFHTIDSASSDAIYDANYRPANVIDGDLSTESRWSSNDAGASIILDLGSTKLVNGIRTSWFRANTRDAYFEVETSVDGSSWTTVIADGLVTGTQDLATFEFEDSEVRYVKIIGKGNSGTGSTESGWTSLIEARVFGCLGDDLPPQVCNTPVDLVITRATSTDDHEVGRGPAKAIDGDGSNESRWSSLGVGNSLVLDLGQSKPLYGIRTLWYRRDQRETYYSLRTSNDNENWTTVFSNHTIPVGPRSYTHYFGRHAARYVELIGLGNSENNWNSLRTVTAISCTYVEDGVDPVYRTPLIVQ